MAIPERRRRASKECENCHARFPVVREWQRFCSTKCRNFWHSTSTVDAICAYCGEPADTKDHFPGKATRERLEAIGLAHRYPYHLVPACKECNCGLGDRPYWSLTERRRFIGKWLAKRYGKYLRAPDWSDSDLAALGPGLQRFVIHRQAIKESVAARIAFTRLGHS